MRMRLLGSFVHILAKISRAISVCFDRVSRLCDGLVPALIRPSDLNSLTRKSYDEYYSKEDPSVAFEQQNSGLEQWETQVFNTYHVNRGRMLVLGSGVGRESIAIARRGVVVVGVDANYLAVRTAIHFAKTMEVRALFLVASFLELPFAAASFDFVLLTNVMYSAIPDASARQAWLRGLRHVLKPNGQVILSFASEPEPASRLKRICDRLNTVLAHLPGANTAYRTGDAYAYGHFMHFFQHEDEIHTELLGAHVTIHELNWAHQFAVVTPCLRTSSPQDGGQFV